MAGSPIVTIELVLVLGCVSVWAAYELWSLRRDRKRRERETRDDTDPR